MSLTESGNPEHLKLAFWIACMDAQVWEMREAAAKNDFRQFRKELADCALVALDAIRLLGLGDSFMSILDRSISNVPKFTEEGLAKTGPRDTAYYLAKIERIKKELGLE